MSGAIKLLNVSAVCACFSLRSCPFLEDCTLQVSYYIFTGSIARSANLPVFSLFRGRHVVPMGVKFGTEEGTEDPLLHAKFHPHRCNGKGVGLRKLKFLLRFDRNVEYKRPAGAYTLAIFTKFAHVVPHFRARWVLKLGWICSRGYGVMGVLR